MKRNLFIRLSLVPIKALIFTPTLILNIICYFIAEENFGDQVLDWVVDFGNYIQK